MTVRGTVRAWVDAALVYAGDACLVWPFRVATSGYGEMSRDGVHWLAHRWVCAQVYGAPFADADAAHACGNRLCCNPRHLRWATRSENHADKRGHGKHLEGEGHPSAVLSASDVRAILASSTSGAEIAIAYGVNPNTVYAIRNGRSWKCLSA